MDEEKIRKLIELAKKIAKDEDEYKSEIFSAIMISGLIRDGAPQVLLQESLKTATTTDIPSNKKMSLREFVISKDPKNDIEKTAVYAYYIENFEGKETFTVKDLITAFRNSKEPVPSNSGDKIQKCISKGWIAKGEQNRTYTLTNSGIFAVEKGFKRD